MQKQRGFTLIELLAVIAIIGILAALILVSLSKARQSARDTQRKSIVRAISQAEESYANDNGGNYAPSHTDLAGYLSGGTVASLTPQCLATNKTDFKPWNNTNCLSTSTSTYNVKTYLESSGKIFECKIGGSCSER